MKAGRPKTATDAPAKQARPRFQKRDAAAQLAGADPDATATVSHGKLNKAGLPRRTRANNQSRRKEKTSLAGLLMKSSLLTVEDRAAVKHAHEHGLTPQDVAALVVFEVRLALRFFKQDVLAPKDLIVALNKAASQAAATAQLSAGSGALPARIEIAFSQGDLPSALDLPERQVNPRPAPGPTGDRLDVAG